jgi:dTMP kinase
MKIYFGASVSLSRDYLKQYRRIVKEIKALDHVVLSEYVVDPKLIPGVGLKPGKLFERETKTIERADLMVAEVTQPSWGTAFLMEHALEKGIPVLALFYKEAEHELPLMISGHPELYVEHYDENNLKVILKKNLDHFASRRAKRGKLIVIEGTDGSGKATQTKLLIAALKKLGKKVRQIEFPRYYTSFHGAFVGRYMKGEFGDINGVSPYLISLAYALDRLSAREEILSWLKEGALIVADRYVTASLAHQTAKVKTGEKKNFFNWLYELEYKVHKLPKEDVVIFLHVPIKVAQKMIAMKTKRKYVGADQDIAEKDLTHQKETLKVYLQMSKENKHWVKIDCVNKFGKLRSRQEIHRMILDALKERKII